MNTIRYTKRVSGGAFAFSYLPSRFIDAGLIWKSFTVLLNPLRKLVKTVQVHLIYRVFHDLFIYKTNELT